MNLISLNDIFCFLKGVRTIELECFISLSKNRVPFLDDAFCF